MLHRFEFVLTADDVVKAVEQLRRERSIGLSEAVNELVRKALVTRHQQGPFRQRTYSLGPARIDVTNVAETLELLEGPAGRRCS